MRAEEVETFCIISLVKKMTEKVKKRNGRWRETEDKENFWFVFEATGGIADRLWGNLTLAKSRIWEPVENSFTGKFFHLLSQPARIS